MIGALDLQTMACAPTEQPVAVRGVARSSPVSPTAIWAEVASMLIESIAAGGGTWLDTGSLESPTSPRQAVARNRVVRPASVSLPISSYPGPAPTKSWPFAQPRTAEETFSGVLWYTQVQDSVLPD